MSIGRLARFAGAIFVASMVLVGPGTTAIADPTPAPAVGVYPPVIHFDRALRGGKFLATFGVLNGTGRGEYFNFGLAGATAAWLRLDSSANHTTAITKVWAPGPARPLPYSSSTFPRRWPTVSTAVNWPLSQPRRRPPTRAKRRSGSGRPLM